jgi:positive phototaxis protein PixI
MVNSLDTWLTASSLRLLALDDPPPQETPSSKLLRLSLGLQESVLLPVELIASIFILDVAQILPIPEVPDCVLGVSNWRGEMLWLVDINHLVGYSPLTFTAGKYPFTIVIQENNQSLGLVVDQVYDIESHNLQTLHPPIPGLYPRLLLPFVLGSLPGENNIVLNVTAITQCPLWQIAQNKTKSFSSR